jgi:hypothetical protein
MSGAMRSQPAWASHVIAAVGPRQLLINITKHKIAAEAGILVFVVG